MLRAGGHGSYLIVPNVYGYARWYGLVLDGVMHYILGNILVLVLKSY
jgi:hypothetical protein